ncbi:MAG TPA: molybdopterin cofactor-binding domain-containing protein, partial [Acidiferrobacteraceae bacterium]|nr:molybdopterin cofactor-binding domain-containing protein [Acidiferrobacteraceae bacterium]
MGAAHEVSRRQFLKLSALMGGGFAIGVCFDAPARATPSGLPATAPQPATFVPNAWVRVSPDNVVTIVVDKSEMGQGVWTSMPMLVAEELDADWTRIKIEQAPAADVYKNPQLGVEATGGSTSVASSYLPLRRAGAAARALLVQAAAHRWQVARSSIQTRKGVLYGPDGQSLTYGEVASDAAGLTPPQNPQLKPADQFVLLGRPMARVDIPSKVNGQAVFGLDVKIPGMLVAAVAHSPVFGGRVQHYDASRARAVPGVRDVVPIKDGVAVVAHDYWTAHKGLAAMPITWDEGPNAQVSSNSIHQSFEQAAAHPGAIAEDKGDVHRALANAAHVLHAVYDIPFQAHATMEPMNCTADVRHDRCEIWAPTQNQTGAQRTAAHITGLPHSRIFIHTTMLGGGFGRRFEQDFVDDAVRISKAVGAPVKVVWSREEDMTHDFYRPAVYNRLTG